LFKKAYSTKGNVTTQVPCELFYFKRDIILNKTDAKPATATGARGAGFGGGFLECHVERRHG
jgi:hypothetical protein